MDSPSCAARVARMPSPSFRQYLIIAFLTIAVALTGVAVQGVGMLEEFALRSRAASADSLLLSRSVQSLGERAVDMARSARQYRVLEEPGLLRRFEASRAEAIAAIDSLGALRELELGALQSQFEAWRAVADELASTLEAGAGVVALDDPLARLASLGGLLAAGVRERIEAHNRALLDALDANRARLALQVAIAVALSILLALSLGAWLVRSLARLERAIADLGDGAVGRPIAVGGPRDMRTVGERLEWLRQRLLELESDRSRVLRHVSHELKTPLAALREGSALLDDRVLGPLVPAQREVVDILKHNCAVLQARVEALLGVNAAAFDARRLDLRPLDPADLLRSVVEEHALQIQGRRIEVSVEGSADPIRADREKLALIVGNLLSNALAFSPPGSLVRLVAARRGRRLHIDCIDEGPGIRAEDAPRIFDPFFRGARQPEGREDGTGIGLSIVREFAVAHGGAVMLVPAALGCHIRVELPYAR